MRGKEWESVWAVRMTDGARKGEGVDCLSAGSLKEGVVERDATGWCGYFGDGAF